MKKNLLVICIIALVMSSNTGILKTSAAEPTENFLSVDEAMKIGQGFVDDFNRITKDGTVDQYIGTWAYDVLINWREVSKEIGTYYGIKSSTATVDAEKAVIKVETHGTKRIGVLEFTLYYEEEPEVIIYSKFSLTKWLVDSGIGAILIIFNTIAVLVLFILYLKKPKALPVAEKNQAIDDTIANIILNEEKVDEETVALGTIDEETAALETMDEETDNNEINISETEAPETGEDVPLVEVTDENSEK